MGLVHSKRDSRTPNCFTLVLLSYTKIQILPFLLVLVLLPFLFTLSSSSSSPKIQNSTSLFTSTLLTQQHKLPEALTSHLEFLSLAENPAPPVSPPHHPRHPPLSSSWYKSYCIHQLLLPALRNSNHHHHHLQHHHHHPQLPSRLQSDFRRQHLKLLLQDNSSF